MEFSSASFDVARGVRALTSDRIFISSNFCVSSVVRVSFVFNTPKSIDNSGSRHGGPIVRDEAYWSSSLPWRDQRYWRHGAIWLQARARKEIRPLEYGWLFLYHHDHLGRHALCLHLRSRRWRTCRFVLWLPFLLDRIRGCCHVAFRTRINDADRWRAVSLGIRTGADQIPKVPQFHYGMAAGRCFVHHDSTGTNVVLRSLPGKQIWHQQYTWVEP